MTEAHDAADPWQLSEARDRLSELVDAALAGQPQIVRRADGREVVVVSRDVSAPDQTSTKDFLLTQGNASAEDADEFDRILVEARHLTTMTFTPQLFRRDRSSDVRPRHRHRKLPPSQGT